MHLGIRICKVFAGMVLLLVLATSLLLGTDSKNSLPSVAELEKLTFAPVSGDSYNSLHENVAVAKGLFVAYRGGLDALSKYHDPILTRGGFGISVFKSVSPAVVVVVVGRMKDQDFDPEGIGTGAIVDARGYVLTNWHVINGYSGALVFLKPSGSTDLANAKAFGAKVIYQDSTVDLALLKLVNPPAGLPSLAVGDISQVQVAQDIHIIGHPHGNLWSYSTGVVSQVRDSYSWTYEDRSKHVAKVLQLQTAINPGNSGGPVVDDYGKILGLVAMSEAGQNLDYAIAADAIKRFLVLGMQPTTRGVEVSVEPSVRPDQVFAAKLADGSLVLKAVYSGLVLYSVGTNDKQRIGLIAKFTDGTVIKAWNVDPFGTFGSWSAILPDRRQFIGAQTNGVLDIVSLK